MKKSLLWVFLLLGGCVTGFLLGLRFVDGQKDDVILRQEVLAGDPAAAQGLSFHIRVNSGENLVWDTVCIPGEDMRTQTTFLFSGKGDPRIYTAFPEIEDDLIRPWRSAESIYDRLASDTSGTSGQGNLFFPSEVSYTMNVAADVYADAVLPVLEEAPVGKTYTRTVRLKDYYDDYPLGIWLDYEGSRICEIKGEEDRFRDGYYEIGSMLRIPVSPQHLLEISVTKDGGGNVTRVDVEEQQWLHITGTEVSTSDGVYFSFFCKEEGKDEPWVSGSGNGIYRLPVTRDQEGKAFLWYDRIEKVCALPEDCLVEEMIWDEEKDRLLLQVTEDGCYRLDQMDLKQNRVRPGIPLLAVPETGNLEMRPVGEGWLLLTGNSMFVPGEEEGAKIDSWSVPDCTFVFAGEGEEGFEPWITGQIDGLLESYNYMSIPCYEAAFQDGRLAILSEYGRYDDCSAELSVFDRQGLLYRGLYHHSGDDLEDYYQTAPSYLPWDMGLLAQEGLELEFLK